MRRGPKNVDRKRSGPHKNNLRALRMRDDLTQKEVAERIGKTAIDISRLENGHVAIRSHDIIQLSNEFGWSAEEIVGEKGVSMIPGTVKDEISTALTTALMVAFDVFIYHNLASKRTFISAFSQLETDYRKMNMPQAAETMRDLATYFSGENHNALREKLGDILHLNPAGSA